MIHRLKGKIRSGYAVAFFLLVLSYFLILGTTDRLYRQSGSVIHSHMVLERLEQFYSALLSSEAGARGYMLTNKVAFLKPYREARAQLLPLIRYLYAYFKKDTLKAKIVSQIQTLSNRRMRYLEEAIVLYQRSGYKVTSDLVQQKLSSLGLMDTIRQHILMLSSLERAYALSQRSQLSGYFSGVRTITLVSLITAIIAIGYSVITYTRENRDKQYADQKAKLYEAELKSKITELESMNHELSELRSNEKFAATGRIARTIAHEVRNPLTNISLAAEQLQEGAGKNQESLILLDMIIRNTERINQLVSDLLYATRFVQLNMTKADIRSIVDDALAMATDRIELNGIRVQKVYSPENCPVLVDMEKIKIAFLNIIVNAIEAMENNKGVMRIKTYTRDNRCVVEIADNGTGMDTDTIQKLFEPYFTIKPRGNGLGLTNSQNIIMSHKGIIKVASQLGQGTVFQIFLNIEPN